MENRNRGADRTYRVELTGGDATPTADDYRSTGVLLSKYVEPVKVIPNARWVRSGNSLTLFGGNMGWGTTDRWVSVQSVTAKWGFLSSYSPTSGGFCGIGFFPIGSHILLDPPDGDGSLGLQWNSNGILTIELVHG
jgi:hypothetical protein